ncbi:MAG TPA: DUF6364 family protein [Hanamia sp.]
MNTKLTLTIEESVINKAKEYAKSKGDSLSGIVENYLKAVTKNSSLNKNVELTPLVKSLKGSFKAPVDFDYKKELQNELSKKYNF